MKYNVSYDKWIAYLQRQVKTALEIRQSVLDDDPDYAEQLLMIAAAAGAQLKKWNAPIFASQETTQP